MDGALIDGTLNTTVDITLVNSKIGTININPDEGLSANTKVLQETASAVDEAVDRLVEEASHVITKDGSVDVSETLPRYDFGKLILIRHLFVQSSRTASR
jgi:hypothetical protein